MFYYNWFIGDLFFEITCNTIPQVNTNNNITIGKDTPVLGFSGTSLIVEPAASLINYFRGKNLVIINNDETPYDKRATLIINEDLTNVFKLLS